MTIVITMDVETPATPASMQNVPVEFRRLFFTHVGTLVLTAALVAPLILGIASIPAWVSVAYCVVIGVAAFAYIAASIKVIRGNHGSHLCLVLTLGLSVAQLIFTLPVIICFFAPTFRV
ncbi:MAG: hypothetical protein AAGG48_31480 [Planctomycetota bacterium]